MKIAHKTRRVIIQRPKTLEREFIEAFIADNASNPAALTPALRAFVQRNRPKKDQ